jgi:adenosylcobinamide-phosphate synthase
MTLVSLAAAVCADMLIGDPRWLPHPVRWIGSLIQRLETLIYPKEHIVKSGSTRGMVLCLTVIAITASVGLAVMWLSLLISPVSYSIAAAVIGFYCMSARSLAREAVIVRMCLSKGEIKEARKALSLIVGRDTEHLSETDIARATVETVGENIVDGIISPMFYLALGGPIAALVFKAVSTMDSMIGYRNERYRSFGTCAARLDDALNFVPARLGGFLLIPLGAALVGMNPFPGIHCVFRDRLKHPSPNSAHGESAVAGIVGVELGGKATYNGTVSCKPRINAGAQSPDEKAIKLSVRLVYATTAASLLIFAVLKILIDTRYM